MFAIASDEARAHFPCYFVFGVDEEIRTEDEFVDEVRKFVWDWLTQFQSTETMDPHQRLAFLRRRMWLRGRRLELLSQTRMVDYDKLLRIVALADD